MIPGAFLLVQIQAAQELPGKQDVPRNISFTCGELTFSHRGDRSEKKEIFKKHTSYLYTFLQDFWELQSKLQTYRGKKKEENN